MFKSFAEKNVFAFHQWYLLYQRLISYSRPIQYSFPFPLPQLELETWTLNCFQFNSFTEDAAFLSRQENAESKTISIKLPVCGKIARPVFVWMMFCLRVSHVSSLLMWWTRLSSFSKSSMEFAIHSIFLLNTTRSIIWKAWQEYWKRKASSSLFKLYLFCPPWPTWSFNIVERSNFLLSVFLLEVNGTKKLPLSWKDIMTFLSIKP